MARVSSSIPKLVRFTNKPTSSQSNPNQTHQFFSLLDASKTVTQVFQIHSHLISLGLFDSFWARKILKLYWDFSHIDYTVSIFKYIQFPGTYCVNSVIKAYSVSSNPSQALVFYFDWLRNGFCPNSHTFVPIIRSCAKISCVKSGKKFHGQAFKNGVESVIDVKNSLLFMYGRCGEVELARKVFDEMPERDFVSWTSLIDGYVRAGEIGVAEIAFEAMPERDVGSWNVISRGFLRAGDFERVLEIFREISRSGLKGDGGTMVSLIVACGRMRRLREGRSVHGFLIRNWGRSSVFLDTSLIDMYSKCRKVGAARRVFDRVSGRNLVCWNAMIMGHCVYGDPEAGISLFEELVENREEISPDEVTFIGVLCACARAQMLEEGKDYFRQMSDVFDLKRNFAHYWCLANVYASVGLDKQAEQTIREIPEDGVEVSSESLLWAKLLSSCRFQNDVSFGEEIAKSLIEKEPHKLAYYRLLMTIYAVAGRWHDVAKVKEMAKGNISGLVPGCNLIDLKEIVHNLRADKHLPQHEGEPDYASLAQKLRSSTIELDSYFG